jgi:hypothetical protein
MITANGLALGEGGAFQHKISYEALNFKFSKNCHTKPCTATFAKRLLQAALISINILSQCQFSVLV